MQRPSSRGIYVYFIQLEILLHLNVEIHFMECVSLTMFSGKYKRRTEPEAAPADISLQVENPQSANDDTDTDSDDRDDADDEEDGQVQGDAFI